jgi:hypothetical protein
VAVEDGGAVVLKAVCEVGGEKLDGFTEPVEVSRAVFGDRWSSTT